VPGLQLPLANESPRLIVGVVANLLEYYGATPTPSLYVPLGADPSAYGSLLIRMAPGVVPSAAALQQTAVGIIGQTAVTITPATEGMDVMLADPRFRAVLLALFAVCALVLAAAGLYALASFEAATRRAEMGIRLALGASARRLRRLILGETLRPVLLGSIVGLVAAYWAASFVQAFWYQVDARDLWTFALAAFVLVATALVAAWLPARRAARTDPAIVLRST
jgi:ABC-type antimicrobial peptide transport system permease subunit